MAQSLFEQKIIADDYGALIEVVDLDEDGDYDIIATDFTNGHVNWYTNDGSESFTKNNIDNSGMTSAYRLRLGILMAMEI